MSYLLYTYTYTYNGSKSTCSLEVREGSRSMYGIYTTDPEVCKVCVS